MKIFQLCRIDEVISEVLARNIENELHTSRCLAKFRMACVREEGMGRRTLGIRTSASDW